MGTNNKRHTYSSAFILQQSHDKDLLTIQAGTKWRHPTLTKLNETKAPWRETVNQLRQRKQQEPLGAHNREGLSISVSKESE